jgi:hypothetical protein
MNIHWIRVCLETAVHSPVEAEGSICLSLEISHDFKLWSLIIELGFLSTVNCCFLVADTH